MNPNFSITFSRLLIVSTVILISSCAGSGGIKDSDPHLVGNRDMRYDHLIVPGERIGPVRMGGSVSDAVQHLGEPDSVSRSTFRGPGYDSDEVYYYYTNECVWFTWQDSGIEPKIESGLRGINVNCDKWSTSSGIHVGMPIKDAISRIGEYCASNRDDGSLIISTKVGIWFEAPNRNSTISIIRVMPVTNTWGGQCKD
jgi:hypothetical protein